MTRRIRTRDHHETRSPMTGAALRERSAAKSEGLGEASPAKVRVNGRASEPDLTPQEAERLLEKMTLTGW